MTSSSQSLCVFDLTCLWAKEKKIPLKAYEKIGSTHLEAYKGAFCDPPLKLYVARFQTEGRGRRKRVWVSPEEGKALLVTFSFKKPSSFSFVFPLLAGFHVWKTVKQFFPYEEIKIKAPNDLYFGEKKIGGLLIQVARGRVMIGLGLNVLDSPKELSFSGKLVRKESLFTKKLMFHFLDELVKWPLEEKELSLKARSELKKALKPFPGELLIDITSFGDLVFKKRKVLWHNL